MDQTEGTRPRVAGREPRRIALVLEYDGTEYRGFQRQTRSRTIQGELERALEGLTGAATRTQGAGRTDAGAHAKGQVAAFTTTAPYPQETFQRALNATLPFDIRVRAAREVDLRFDPRRHALSRVYRYLILPRATPSVFWRRYVHQAPEGLDIELMDRAARMLVGCHDFRAFSGRGMVRGRGSVRRMMRAEVTRRGSLVAVELEADAFLPHQVRRIAGTLVSLGLGKMDIQGFESLTRSGDPAAAGAALPARGLYLVRLTYREELEAGDGTGRGLAVRPQIPGTERGEWAPWLR